EDFVSTLSRCMDAAIEQSVDLVLFGGDAFPDATPPPIVQQAFAQQFRRLVDAQIPTILLVGNHDQHSQGMGGASLCIYRTLGIPGFVVGDKLETHPIQTASGPVQVVTLPWLTRSTLLTRPETEGLSMGDVGELLLDRLRVALEAEIRQLDPAVPAILLAHVMTDTARFGAERFLAVGKGFTVPMSLLARPCFDYVALGHVHKHQVICQNPLMVYPGSIERVDFSEEKEDKGYVMLSLDKGKAEMSFCPLPARPFRTISVDLTKADEPNEKLLKAIAKAATTDTVVRLLYKLRADQIDSLDNAALHKALAAAHTYTIHPELVSQLSRPRLPELGADNSLEPVTALQAYLANREDLKDIASDMIAAAEALLQQEPAGLLEPLADEDLASIEEEDENRQLRLL
ncbi:MAG: exonuclease SbcCD subunit D, partial [Cyanobacteria bacterium J06627_15]